ncbi:kelch repeat-containing protein [Paenibacillus sp. YIM B09110]|uniref:kelch repeat-containing protein n=1 Tax=Paenibacillus sp. YIM B09110 TaxID=3126102 RepID=UPI00301E144A
MKKIMITLLALLMILSVQLFVPDQTSAQAELKVKSIFSGYAPRMITTEGKVWEYGAVKSHQMIGLDNIISLSFGNSIYGTYALKADGTVWKFDSYYSKAMQIPKLNKITAIAQNYDRVYAIDKDGVLRYESNEVFQTKVKEISSSDEKLLVVFKDGTVGKQDFSNGYKWSKLTGLKNIVSVYAGFLSDFALDSNGQVWAWGDNGSGDLGDGTTIDRSTPVKVKGLPKIKAIGNKRALAVDGTVWTWGDNTWGQLGDGSPATPDVWAKTSNSYDPWNIWYFPYTLVSSTPHPTPVKVKGLTNIVQISNDYALDQSGVLWGWGDNRRRTIINSPVTAITEPVRIPLMISSKVEGAWSFKDYKQTSKEAWSTVLSDGRLFTTGYNDSFLYDPAKKQYTRKPLLIVHDAIKLFPLLNGGILQVENDPIRYGGTNFRIINVDTQKSYLLPKAPENLDRNVGIVPLSKGRIMFIGDEADDNSGYNHAYVYDLYAKKWTKLSNMNEHRLSPVGVELPDGRVFVAGGRTLAGTDLEVYDFKTQKWEPFAAELPEVNDVNNGTIEVLTVSSTKVVIHANSRLYVYDLELRQVKEYATPGSDGIFLMTRLLDGRFMMLGKQETYAFDANTGAFTALSHPNIGFYINVTEDKIQTRPNGEVLFIVTGNYNWQTEKPWTRVYTYRP